MLTFLKLPEEFIKSSFFFFLVSCPLENIAICTHLLSVAEINIRTKSNYGNKGFIIFHSLGQKLKAGT